MTEPAQKTTPFIIADVDGTLIRWQLFHRLAEGMVEYGLLPQVVITRMKEALEQYKNRVAPFKTFVDAAVDAYQGGGRMRGIRLDDLNIVAREIIKQECNRVHVFTRELLLAGKARGYGTAFISGSPVQVVHQLAIHYGVDAWLGTEHPHESGVFTGGRQHEWVMDKRAAVRHLEELHGINLSRSVAIGDSESDIPMLELVGFPIVFNPNEGLYREARSKRWPVVREKKIITVDRFDERKMRHESSLFEILPKDLIGQMADRLQRAGIHP
ncbi:MAG TPA: HAD family phosphatase [Candidatus Methylomirabilis sp.]|nr:HAD family phosphatase [Candidatus Methylomirabilis sp.]